jgi:hypothetical protein
LPSSVVRFRAFATKSVGWIIDCPTVVLSDGRRLRRRLTAVVRWENDGWKLLQLHICGGA